MAKVTILFGVQHSNLLMLDPEMITSHSVLVLHKYQLNLRVAMDMIYLLILGSDGVAARSTGVLSLDLKKSMLLEEYLQFLQTTLERQILSSQSRVIRVDMASI